MFNFEEDTDTQSGAAIIDHNLKHTSGTGAVSIDLIQTQPDKEHVVRHCNRIRIPSIHQSFGQRSQRP